MDNRVSSSEMQPLKSNDKFDGETGPTPSPDTLFNPNSPTNSAQVHPIQKGLEKKENDYKESSTNAGFKNSSSTIDDPICSQYLMLSDPNSVNTKLAIEFPQDENSEEYQEDEEEALFRTKPMSWFISSDCCKYTLYFFRVRSRMEAAVSYLIRNSDNKRIKIFPDFRHVCFIPGTTILVGELIMGIKEGPTPESEPDWENESDPILVAYDCEKEAWISRNNSTAIDKKNRRNRPTSELCSYLSLISDDIFSGVSTNPQESITGAVICNLEPNERSSEIRVIFFYGGPRTYDQETKSYKPRNLDPVDLNLQVKDVKLRNYENTAYEEIRLLKVNGGKEALMWGVTKQGGKGEFNLCQVEWEPVINQETKRISEVFITLLPKRSMSLPPEVASTMGVNCLVETNFWDVKIEGSYSIPPVIVKSAGGQNFLLDFNKPEVEVMAKFTSGEVDSIQVLGARSEFIVGVKKDKAIKIWIKKIIREDFDPDPYLMILDIQYKQVTMVHVPPDLTKLWVESGTRNLVVYKFDLLNKPIVNSSVPICRDKAETKYVTDGVVEIIANSSILSFQNKENPRLNLVMKREEVLGSDTDKERQLLDISMDSRSSAVYYMLCEAREDKSCEVTFYKTSLDFKLQPFSDSTHSKKLSLPFIPEKAFLLGGFVCLPDKLSNLEYYSFRSLEGSIQQEIGRKFEIQKGRSQYGLINDQLAEAIPKQKGDLGKVVLYNHQGNSRPLPFEDGSLEDINVSSLHTNSRLGNKSKLLVHASEGFKLVDVDAPTHSTLLTRLCSNPIGAGPKLSPSGSFLCYLDDRMVKLAEVNTHGQQEIPVAAGLSSKEREGLQSLMDKQLTSIPKETQSIDFIFSVNQKANKEVYLILLFTADDFLNLQVWSLADLQMLYHVVSEAEFELPSSQSRHFSSCSFIHNKTCHITYFSHLTRTTTSIKFAPSSSMVHYFYKTYSSCKTTMDKQLTLRRMEGYFGAYAPNKYLGAEPEFLDRVNKDRNNKDAAVFLKFLNQNPQVEIDLKVFDAFNFYADLRSDRSDLNPDFFAVDRKFLVEFAQEEAEKNIQNSVFDVEKTSQFVAKNNQVYMQNQDYREIFKVLLQSNTGETVSCELADEFARSFPFVSHNNRIGIGFEIDHLKQELQRRPAEDFTTYEIHRSLVKLDLSAGSVASNNLFLTIQKLMDSDLEGPMQPLVYYMWNKLYYFSVFICLAYWTMAGLGFAFFGLYPSDKGLAIALFVFNGLFILYEIKGCISNGFRLYFESIWNWADLVILLFSIAINVTCLTVNNNEEVKIVIVRIIAFTLLYLRAITWFGVFRPTRYLITMVLQVFIDMIPFLAIFISGIIGFGLIWRMAGQLEHPPTDGDYSPDPLYDTIYASVMLIFGNGPSGEANGSNFRGTRFFFIIVGNVVLSLCFLNFLIAVISGTYSRVDEKKMLYDVKGLLKLIIELNSFLKNLVWWKSEPSFFFTLHSKDSEGAIEEKVSSIDSKIDKIDQKFEAKLDKIISVLQELNSKKTK